MKNIVHSILYLNKKSYLCTLEKIVLPVSICSLIAVYIPVNPKSSSNHVGIGSRIERLRVRR